MFNAPSGVTYTKSEIRYLIDPITLDDQRKEILRQALSLVGRVSYFWGGKSTALGWDEHWGQLKQVTASGSSTTGKIIPYGLDCTGYVDWVMLNAGVDTYSSLYAYDWGEHISSVRCGACRCLCRHPCHRRYCHRLTDYFPAGGFFNACHWQDQRSF